MYSSRTPLTDGFEIGRGAAILGLSGTKLTPDETAFFKDYDPFGFILFARNIENPDQTRALTASLRDLVGRDAPILVDQEGGRVQRLRAPHWHNWATPLETIQRLGPNHAAAAMEMRMRVIAAELRDVGIDSNCAPVADVATAQTHPFLRNRCYGEDPQSVARIARAVSDGLLAGGVLPVIKHLPGHGRAQSDSHLHLPEVSASAEDLAAHDFLPFKLLADVPMAMTAHIVFHAYDARPATQSPVMIDVIRQQIGFDGLLMSDDLNMQALQGTLFERTAATIKAGVDIALHCNGALTEMQDVANAAGDMTASARSRAARAIAMRKPAPQVEIADLMQSLRAFDPQMALSE